MANGITMRASTLVEVNTTILQVQTIATINMNQILLLTSETPIVASAAPFKYYTEASQVAKDYGTNSKTHANALALFSQSFPNFLSAEGSLCIAQAFTTEATYTSFITPQILDYTPFYSVEKGAMDVDCDGITYELRNLNFTSANTDDEVTLVLQKAMGEFAKVELNSSNPPSVIFSTKTPGLSGSIVLSSPSVLPLGAVDITGANYLDISNGATSVGINASGETLEEACVRLSSVPNSAVFHTVITNLILNDIYILDFAQYCQTFPEKEPLKYIVGLESRNSCDPLNGIASIITQGGFTQTKPLLHFTQPVECACAYASVLCSALISQPNSAQNAIPSFSKQLVGIESLVVDRNELETFFKPAGVDMYLSIGFKDGIISSSANGGGFETVYFANSISLYVEEAYANIFANNVLTVANSNDLLKNTGEEIFTQAVQCGMVVPGVEWKEPLPQGIPPSLESIFKQNIFANGYYVYVYPLQNRTLQEILEELARILNSAILNGSVKKAAVFTYLQQS